MTQSPIIEAGKEFARVCVLAAIPIIIDGLIANDLNIRLIAITAAIAGLRFVDKLLHEAGKNAPDKSIMTGGLTRF